MQNPKCMLRPKSSNIRTLHHLPLCHLTVAVLLTEHNSFRDLVRKLVVIIPS